MGEPRLFKTIISKLLNSPTEDWNIQVKSESNSRLVIHLLRFTN